MMEREKREINKVAVFCHTIIAIALLASYALEVVKGARTIGYYIVFVIFAATPLIMEWILYKRNPADTKIQHVLGIGYEIFYVFVIFTTNNVTAFTFAIPLYIVIALYSDLRYCIFISMSGFAANIIFTIYQALTVGIAAEEMATYEIRNILMFLVAVFLCMTTDVMSKISKMKMEELEKEKETVSTLLNNVMSISGKMSEGIGDVRLQMQELGEAVSETRNAMQEVSGGTSDTANAIQKQLGQTEEIQRHVEEVENVSKNIGESMEQAKGDLQHGKESLDTLLARVESSEQAGNEVVTDIGELEEYMKNMQSIIELITSVASQTSLLALNASIEAARAGEAGKGFAVVATEISSLANQTQSATVNITEVINNVSSKLTIAVNAVEQLMNNNKMQNESAVTVADSFEKITRNTENANDQSGMLEEVVANLAAANAGIIEGIQTISAVMEEVTAHSNETYNISDRNAGIVEHVSSLVENLNEQAQSLNSYS